MSSTKFYIERRRDKNGRIITQNVPILLYFSFEGKRLQLNTGERINAGDWDRENQVARNGSPGSKQLNHYLSSLAEEVKAVYREAKALGLNPGTSHLREQLKTRRRKDSVDFFDVLMRFIEENNSRWSIYTFRQARTAYNHLRRFSEQEQADISFNRIDAGFMDRYARYFRIKYNHSNNTILKNINILKWFLNWAADRGYNRSSAYRDYYFTWEVKPRKKDLDLVLDWEELTRIYRFEAFSAENLKEVRDIFCFMCFSGLKLSRVYQLKEAQVYGDHIRLPDNNSDGCHVIPLNKQAEELLNKYADRDYPGGACFPHYSAPYFNQLLKRVGREAGISRFVSVEMYSGSERGSRQVPKYEILSSKVAVNTFLQNGLKLGITPGILAYVTKRKTYSEIRRIRSLIEDAASGEIRRFNTLVEGADRD
jgi:integrase